jgi:hypothetical protein
MMHGGIVTVGMKDDEITIKVDKRREPMRSRVKMREKETAGA